MFVSRFEVTFLLAACILWSHWQGVSSSRLLARNTPELGPAPRHPNVSQAPLSGAQRRTYSSPNPASLAPKPPSPVDIVLLNGGAMVLPAADLSDSSPHSTTYNSSDTGEPPTAAAPLPGSRSSNGASASADQPVPVSKDGIIMIALVGMLILALAAGIDRDGPTGLFLASVKSYVAGAGNRIWCRFTAVAAMFWSSVVAGYQHSISTAATALQQLTVLIKSAVAAGKAALLGLVLSCKSAVSAVQSRAQQRQEALAHRMEITECVCEIRQRQGQQQQKLESTEGAVDQQQLSTAATPVGGNGSSSCTQG